MWRKASIIADAVLGIVQEDPCEVLAYSRLAVCLFDLRFLVLFFTVHWARTH